MAKQGPSEPQFSPFAQIQQGISALTKPVAAEMPAVEVVSRAGETPPRPLSAVTQQLTPSTSVPVHRERLVAPVPQRAAAGEVRRHREQDSLTSALLTTKRFKVSTEESQQVEMAALRLAEKLGVKVDFSKITRALWQIYLRHEEDILRNAATGKTRQRPANDDPIGLAELDEQIAQVVGDGFVMASRRSANRV